MVRRLLCLSIAALAFACTAPETEQPPETRRGSLDPPQPAGYAPLRFDFEGTWVLSPEYARDQFIYNGSACEQQWSRENYLAIGRDTLSLTKGEITHENGNILVPYTGTYSHWEGFGANIDGGVAYGCVAENIMYDVEALLVIEADGGYAHFIGEGVASTSAVYNHPRTIALVAAPSGDPIDGGRSMFERADPDTALLSIGFGSYAGDTSIPDECDFELDDIYWSSRDVSRGCVGIATAAWKFNKTNGSPDVNPKGEIRGDLEALLPDGMGTNNPIEHAVVQLYKQPRFIRDQEPNEPDETYDLYIEREEALRSKAGDDVIVTPSDNGEFVFDEVRLLDRDPLRPTTYRRGYYTIVVTRARTEETTPDAANDQVPYEEKTVWNVQVGDDESIGLKPFEAVAAKMVIADRLRNKAPKAWGPIETSVVTYLEDLADGTNPQTAEANEAVRRALWAEYAARDGLQHADTLLGFMLDAFANLVADFLIPDINFNPRNIAAAQKRIRNYSEQAAKSQSTLDILNSAKIEEFHQRMAAKPNAGMTKALKGRAQVATRIKAITKAVVFSPAKQLANNVASSSNAALAGAIIDSVQIAFDTIVDVMITGSFGGAVTSLLKKLAQAVVKAAKGPLLDSAGPLPISFTQLADDGLQTTLNHLSTWTNDDGALYQTDRAASVATINAMNAEATSLIANQELTKGAGEAAGLIEDVAGGFSFIPAAKWAEKLAKVAKTFANVQMFVDPLIYVFFELPTAVNNAGLQAWGEPISSPSPQRFTGTLVSGNQSLIVAFQTVDTEFRNRFNEIEGALRAHDHETLMDLVYGSDSMQSLGEIYSDLELARDRLLDQAGGIDVYDEDYATTLRFVMPAVIEDAAATADIVASLRDFLLDVVTGGFPSTTDGWYRARQTRLLWDLELYRPASGFFNLVSRTDPQIGQLVRAEDLVITDENGAEHLDPSSPHTLTVTAAIRNLSNQPIDGPFDVRLEATAGSGVVTVNEPLQTVTGTLGAFDDPMSEPPGATLTWTIEYAPGELDDAVVVRLYFEEAGDAPTRYHGSGSIAVFEVSDADADLDGLPDAWEARYGLPVDVDSFEDDPDGDGLPTGREYALGLDPTSADTDGDGRSDGDEMNGGPDGVTSDPHNPDSDEDGTLDGTDLAPLDETTTDAVDAAEPCIAVDVDTVVLTPEEPAAILTVSNPCDGELRWAVHSEDEDVVTPILASANQVGTQLVLIPGVPFGAGFSTSANPPPNTVVWLYDTAGREPDGVAVTVSLWEPLTTTGGDDMGTDMGDTDDGQRDMGARGPQTDLGSSPPQSPGGNEDGCCSTLRPTAPKWLWLLVLGVLLVRRR